MEGVKRARCPVNECMENWGLRKPYEKGTHAGKRDGECKKGSMEEKKQVGKGCAFGMPVAWSWQARLANAGQGSLSSRKARDANPLNKPAQANQADATKSNGPQQACRAQTGPRGDGASLASLRCSLKRASTAHLLSFAWPADDLYQKILSLLVPLHVGLGRAGNMDLLRLEYDGIHQ